MAQSCASLSALSVFPPPVRNALADPALAAAARAATAAAAAAFPAPANARGHGARALRATAFAPLVCAVVYAETPTGHVLALRPPRPVGSGPGVSLPVTLVGSDETPFAAARRALFEQTGHESHCWQPLGPLAASANSPHCHAQLFRVWRAQPTASIWTDGLTVPEVVALSPLELANRFDAQPWVWFDLRAILARANPRRA